MLEGERKLFKREKFLLSKLKLSGEKMITKQKKGKTYTQFELLKKAQTID